MALAVAVDDVLTADGSEQTIGAAQTDSNTYVLAVDLVNMAAGDLVVIRAKVKVLTTSTAHTIFRATFTNAQPYPVVQTPPIVSPFSVTFTLQQTGAGYRDFDYSIMTLE